MIKRPIFNLQQFLACRRAYEMEYATDTLASRRRGRLVHAHFLLFPPPLADLSAGVQSKLKAELNA